MTFVPMGARGKRGYIGEQRGVSPLHHDYDFLKVRTQLAEAAPQQPEMPLNGADVPAEIMGADAMAWLVEQRAAEAQPQLPVDFPEA